MTYTDIILLALLIPGLLLVLLVVAIVLPRALRDEARLRNHHCLNCGYDLRQSPSRCPECGAPRSQTPPT